jgi:Mg-chelatase subunit ChlD
MSIPQSFLCPITQEKMVDPVSDENGHTFERSAIEAWLKKHQTSPITNLPYTSYVLVPNRSLRDAMEESDEKAMDEKKSIPVLSQSQSAPLLTSNPNSNPVSDLSQIKISAHYTHDHLHIKITPPEMKERHPVDICCVIDTSGSMQNEVSHPSAERTGLTQLDMVKHAVKTIVGILGPRDRLSLVQFNSHATVVLPLTWMKNSGKQEAIQQLERLVANYSTNIWDGMKKGLDLLKESRGRNSSLFLLTDGEPTQDPPMGYQMSLEKYKTENGISCTMNTFGFGYANLNSKLLESISVFGNGMYAFIPDASFVGTIFINAMANVLSTIWNNLELVLKIDTKGMGPLLYPGEMVQVYNDKIKLNMGSLQEGQTRDFLIPLKMVPENLSYSWTPFLVDYNIPIQTDVNYLLVPSSSHENVSNVKSTLENLRRLQLTNYVRTVVNDFQKFFPQISLMQKSLNDTFSKDLDEKPCETPYVTDVLKDLNGQIHEALSRPEWFKKWGQHFLYSIARAHLMQYCNNFKDPGIQHYGGAMFKKLRDEMDTIYMTLPPPVPSGNVINRIQNMSVFHNAYDVGCIYGSGQVLMADGTTKPVRQIRKGDKVRTYQGVTAQVRMVLKTPTQFASLVQIGDLLITPWHPIHVKGKWVFPHDIHPEQLRECGAVYNFVLSRGHSVIVDNVPCITLGHGVVDDPVLYHPYLGSQKVVEDLCCLDTECTGLVSITKMYRDKTTGLICKLA